MTFAARGIQFTKLGRAFKGIFKKNEGSGELSGFAALCTALSATIGTGNIVGVGTAIAAGGPGALFWMWIAAILGTATKYAECMLAIKYREVKPDGHILGGPLYADMSWRLNSIYSLFAQRYEIYSIDCTPFLVRESTSSFVKSSRVKSSSFVSSAPIIRGERKIHHRFIIVRCSSLVRFVVCSLVP